MRTRVRCRKKRSGMKSRERRRKSKRGRWRREKRSQDRRKRMRRGIKGGGGETGVEGAGIEGDG